MEAGPKLAPASWPSGPCVVRPQDERAELSSPHITAGLCGLPGWVSEASRSSCPRCLGIPVSPAPRHAGPRGALCKERDDVALRE